ncbi:hypothetical protein [Loigolactobacillus bifermentans]|uniref:Uncharacterized protein n=1 Tax=Loigolactobacillus bifermentans DSM 20003 TaxID=1423726 RepID=A0A0R1H3L8_9LACO|nr:hypothetical protein [Loigolactobacillus bifermentans]KRK40601.1 hypothetical protein FC07_GL000009 [Loigolactobacillus bifermentans DSM 20003]QGG60718.1 hypothetical protein LB003_09745 [Loigolactobacillus bifermentans]
MQVWLLLGLLVALLVAILMLTWQLQQLLKVDAMARQLPHPTFWRLIAGGTQNGAGLLGYLILRRRWPVQAVLDQPRKRQQLKISVLAAFAVVVGLGVAVLVVLLFGA